jgi:hypothetical protein
MDAAHRRGTAITPTICGMWSVLLLILWVREEAWAFATINLTEKATNDKDTKKDKGNISQNL